MDNAMSAFLAAPAGALGGGSPGKATGSISELVGVVFGASPVVKAVIVLLVLFILACCFIIVYKYIQIRRAQRQTGRFLQIFWESKRLDAIYNAALDLSRSPTAQLFKAGYIELSKIKGAQTEDLRADETHAGGIENVERALRRATTTEITHLESLVPFLATTGSTAPFVGLFGTVIGIMISFMQIHASGSAGMDVVSKGISEALIATAIGLLAAIPAVIAYNYFLRRIRVLSSEMDNFSADFLNIVKRHFFK
ncbi:MAG: MotA/TolQ/ExbB proton channel family protein [Deltaproteobacteria bacterium]|nr:MotA/TolQ/ExbB proton channel family protein [Deltaproteobacteria bacterium]